MSEREVNTIGHLLEIEQKASELTNQAQLDADKKIAAAKSQADAEFQNQYKQIVLNCENSYSEKISLLESSKKSQISDYQAKISDSQKDFSSFSTFLDSVLLA